MLGIDQGSDGPELYRYLLAAQDTLERPYLHIMHLGNEPLLAGIRKLWQGILILYRPSRPREQIGSHIASGVATP